MVIVLFLAAFMFFISKGVGRHLEHLPKEWHYDSLSINALMGVLLALFGAFLVVGIALTWIAWNVG